MKLEACKYLIFINLIRHILLGAEMEAIYSIFFFFLNLDTRLGRHTLGRHNRDKLNKLFLLGEIIFQWRIYDSKTTSRPCSY